MINRLMVGAVFLVGCAVGGASSQLVIPSADAQRLFTFWEYRCSMANNNEVTPEANKLGSDSWEMVGLTFIAGSQSYQVCFKRPRS